MIYTTYKHIYVLHLYFHLYFESFSTLFFFFQSYFKILVLQVFAYRPTPWYPRLSYLLLLKIISETRIIMVIGPKRNLSILHDQSYIELDLGWCQISTCTYHDMS